MASAQTPNIWAVVPAAGIGSRMQAEIPKQYLPLLDHTVIDITLSKLVSLDGLGGVVVALAENDGYWAKTSFAEHPKVHAIVGGAQRSDSVLAGLRWCLKNAGADCWALVHDAARPCVSTEKIRELISLALNSSLVDSINGAILGVASADTIKRVRDNKIVTTEDRNQLWLAHTPQLFPARILAQAIEDANRADIVITDEASAIEAQGGVVSIVQDRRDNIKITLPEDLLWAETILQKQAWAL